MEENKEVVKTSEIQNNNDKKEINYFLVFVFISLFLVVFSSFYNLFIKRDYDFLIETACDNTSEICFYRDCETGECPPNGLSFYKEYHMRAYDFAKCENEDCTSFCATSSKCEEVRCTDSDIENGICVFPSGEDEANLLQANNPENIE
jgi:hypothetical protein